MRRSFVGSGRPGLLAQTEDAAHVAGGGQHGVFGRQQPGGLALVGLGDEGDAPVGRETVNAAVLVGRKENLALQREHVVDVLFLGAPQRFDGVIGVDAVDRGLLDAAHIHHGVELRGDLGGRGGGGRLGLHFGGLDIAARAGLGFHCDGSGGGGSHSGGGGGLGGLRRAGRELGHRPAQRSGVHGAIRHGNDGADLGQVGVVEHERLILGGNAIEDAVGLGAGEQATLRIHCQPGDVRLAGLVIELALARRGDPVNLPLIAGADIERSIGRAGERPDIAGLRVEVFDGLAVFDAVYLAVGRSARVDRAVIIHGDGEDLGLIGRPVQRCFAVLIDAVDASAMAGGSVQRLIGCLGDGPDNRLVGSEDGLHFGSEREPPLAAERDAVEAAAYEILVGVHLP